MNDAILWGRECWENGVRFGEKGKSGTQHKLGKKYELYLDYSSDTPT